MKKILGLFLLLAGLAAAETASPFYTSQELGLLVRLPPGWTATEQPGVLRVAEPGGLAQVTFRIVRGKDARQVWKNTLADLQKEHEDFEVVQDLVLTEQRCLVLGRYSEKGSEMTGSYAVVPFPGGFQVSRSEARAASLSRVADWLRAVTESATPVK
ncbi:MAG: hypothetical protein AB1758_28950 [Candidatus Eremiobacterota bacterium]